MMKKVLFLFALMFISVTSSASASSFIYTSVPGFNLSIGTGYSPVYTTGCVYSTNPYIYSNIYDVGYCTTGLGINYVYNRYTPPPPPPRHHHYHGHGGPHHGGPGPIAPRGGGHHGGPHGGGPGHHGGGGPHGGGHHR